MQWGITSVHAGDNISTVGDNISTVEGIQYCERIPSVMWGDNSSTCGCSVQWGITSVQWGIAPVLWGIQYIGE